MEQRDRVEAQELSGLQEEAVVQAAGEGLAAAVAEVDHVTPLKVEHTNRLHPPVPHPVGELAELAVALEVPMEVPMEVDDLEAAAVQLEALEEVRLVGTKEYTCTDRNPHRPARHESVEEPEATVGLLAVHPSMS